MKFIRSIPNLTLITFLMAIDKLKGRKIIVIDNEEITFYPFLLPIIQSLKKLKNNGISYYLSTNYFYIGAKEYESYRIEKYKQFDISLAPKLFLTDLFLSAHTIGRGYKKAIRVNIFHNHPIKFQTYPRKDFLNYDVHFLVSPLNREQIEMSIAKYGLENKKIRLFNIGFPKSDSLHKGEYDKEQILTELGLNPKNHTILYAPSWDEGLSLRSSGETIIKTILDMKSFNLIIKLHPVSYTSKNHHSYKFYTGGIDWINAFLKYEKNCNTFRHIKDVGNINPLLAACDIMISDLSSVALEFILLDKPVIYIECQEYFNKTLKKVYSNYGYLNADYIKNDPKANAGRHVGLLVNDISDLPKAIQRSIDNPRELSGKRKALSQKLVYNQGNASQIAADAIIELLWQ